MEQQDLSFFQKVPYNVAFPVKNYNGVWYRFIENYFIQGVYTVNANDTKTITYKINEPGKHFALKSITFESDDVNASNIYCGVQTTNMKRVSFLVDDSEVRLDYKIGPIQLQTNKIIEVDMEKQPVIVDDINTLKVLIQNSDTLNDIDVNVYFSVEILQRLTDEDLKGLFPLAFQEV